MSTNGQFETQNYSREQLQRQIAYLQEQLDEQERQARKEPPLPTEPFERFSERQGCESVQLPNGMLLFENSARWIHGIGRGDNPPSNPVERLTLQREFIEFKLNTIRKHYDRIQIQLAEQAYYHGRNAGPRPDETVNTELNEMESSMAELKHQLQVNHSELRTAELEATRRRYNHSNV